jgi:hypothetical protein
VLAIPPAEERPLFRTLQNFNHQLEIVHFPGVARVKEVDQGQAVGGLGNDSIPNRKIDQLVIRNGNFDARIDSEAEIN